MRLRTVVALAALVPGVAWGQPIVATPLAPPPGTAPQQAPTTSPPPFAQPEPATPAAPQAGPPPAADQTQTQPQPAVPEAPQWANTWVPRESAVLQFLDKVNAQTKTMTVKVGQSVQYESLTVTVQACDVRPPDQPADATAFLIITDSHPGAPGFKGWMLHDEPSVSMLEHPLYDVRVEACGS